MKKLLVIPFVLALAACEDPNKDNLEKCNARGDTVNIPFAEGDIVYTRINPVIPLEVTNPTARVGARTCEVERVFVRWRDPVGRFTSYSLDPYTLSYEQN